MTYILRNQSFHYDAYNFGLVVRNLCRRRRGEAYVDMERLVSVREELSGRAGVMVGGLILGDEVILSPPAFDRYSRKQRTQ